jgi:hypothetical protein
VVPVQLAKEMLEAMDLVLLARLVVAAAALPVLEELTLLTEVALVVTVRHLHFLAHQ